MPNLYPQTSKSTTVNPDPSRPTQNFQNQAWSGPQVQMYNVEDFNHQQPNLTPNQTSWGQPATQHISPIGTTAQQQQQQQQQEGWDWSSSSSTQPDPWSWGGANPQVTTMQNNVSESFNHAGVVSNAQTVEAPSTNWSQMYQQNPDPSWSAPEWQANNYYQWCQQSGVTESVNKEHTSEFGVKTTQSYIEQKEVNPILAGHAPHLFQRSDSWLSGSSLLTINDSLSASQDKLDASHFIPPETLEVVRQHMSEMAIKDKEKEEKVAEVPQEIEEAGSHITNEEVPKEARSTEKNLTIEDEQIRQPPEGAATKITPAIPLISNPSSTSRSSIGSGDGTVTSSASSNSLNQDQVSNKSAPDNHNVETLSPTSGTNNNVNSNLSNSNVTENAVHHVNIYASLIGPREGSPFKPVAKSAASIPAVIQQEVTLPRSEESLVSRHDDHGANLEMMPDNSEQPPTDVETKTSKTSEVNSTPEPPAVPASASLWKEPDMIEAKVFLAPAATIQQSPLVIPQLSEQQQQIKVVTPQEHNGNHRSTENVEDLSHINNCEPVSKSSVEPQVPTKDDKPFDKGIVTSGPLAGRGQRPPVPGLGPVQPPVPGLGPVQPPRAMSEPPKREVVVTDHINIQNRRSGNETNGSTKDRPHLGDLSNQVYPERSDSHHDLERSHSRQGYEERRGSIHKYPERPNSRQGYSDREEYTRGYNERQDYRQGYDRQDHRVGYPERQDYRQDYREERHSYRDDPDYHHRHPDRPDSRQGVRSAQHDYYHDSRQGRVDDRRRGYEYNDRSRYYDDPYYTEMERDRSRPSSRSMTDDREYVEREHGRGRNQEDRPSSRGGYDSDRESGYYRHNTSYDYSRDPYYRRDHRKYRDAQYSRYDQERYYQYYNYYRYGYNSHDYGYIDELYRTDPNFKAQYDAQYRAYLASLQYGGGGGGYDGGSDQRSVQSGRSSVNDDIQREKYSSEMSDSSQSNYPYSVDNNNEYYSKSTEAARLTPVQFSLPHVKVNFSSCSYTKLLANNPAEGQPGVVEIHDLQSLLYDNPEVNELKNFPGPLIRGDTHKNDVIQFCNEKVANAQNNVQLQDKDSYILIWELLILLIRQNGTVVGADIAELLLGDNHSNKPDHENNDGVSSDSASNTEIITPDEGIVITTDRSVINQFSEEAITKKFRECLLSGRKKEALEKAMKNGLWGHALFLASKMDKRTYANVMTRFANSLTLNDPLQTLYQLMSGRQPASVTCVAEEKWGDWRPHLAMILSNPTERPDLDQKSITTMGDTLATRGLLHASQFCYLIAQMDFGSYTTKASKLVLLCANHSLPFCQFATNEAIQCTEIYQYAQQLANPDYIIQSFQIYRFIYATRLMTIGLSQEALHYLEILSGVICKFPIYFYQGMIAQVYELADKLKYLDHHYTNPDVQENSDPEWLLKLNSVLQTYNPDMFQHMNDDVVYSESSAGSEISEGVNVNQIPQTANYYDPTSVLPNRDVTQPITGIQTGYQQNVQQHYTPQMVTDSGSVNHFSYSTDGINAYQQEYQQDYQQTPSGGDNYEGSYYPQEVNSQISNNFQYPNVENTVSGSQVGDYRDLSSKKVAPPSSPLKPDIGNQTQRTTSSTRKSEKKEVKTKAPQTGGGSSWLGGIFSKLIPKPKNQMNLPDDRNPTIVWDDVSKRWVNTEEDGDESTSSPIAPPNDAEIFGRRQSVPKANSTSTPSGDQGLPPPVGNEFNKFRRQGLQKRYVDVVDSETRFKTQVAQLPTNFFPETATSNQQQPQLFIPTNHDVNQSDFNPYSIPPQVGNPGSRSGSPVNNSESENGDLSRSSSQGSLGREVQQYMAPNAVQTALPVNQPILFNPSQFSNKNPTTTVNRSRYPR